MSVASNGNYFNTKISFLITLAKELTKPSASLVITTSISNASYNFHDLSALIIAIWFC